jgi:predicted phage baseplate assembly protein
VDELEWKEATSFYGQAADARIFVTREDDAQKTHVQFGDGVQGARLPSGIDNVKATYRFGSGAEAPDAGSLTVIAHPLPGLKSIRNPVAVGGGADPDPVQQIRRYAPRSVLTFGRAVSGDDYETIAAQAPGVARARAYFSFDPASQRTIARIYVGDNSAARDAAITALSGAVDPNRPFTVTQAAPIPVQLSLSVVVDPARQPETVEAAVSVALLDPDNGLFGANVVRIGKSFFASEIYQACLCVPGVLAVHALEFRTDPSRAGNFQLVTGFRFDTGEGNFFQLQADQLNVSWEAPDYAG